MPQTTSRKLVAELIGTAFLLTTVVGSGIMAERLAGGNEAIILLCNSLPTGAILVVLIVIFGPISGAHFNPVVTVAFLVRREINLSLALAFIAFQISGGLLGTWSAHLMFEESVLQFSEKLRTGPAQWFAEVIASFGLLMSILGALRWRPNFVPYSVGLYITAAYWFTSSTSFANPAVTIARSYTNTFSGILLEHIPTFILAQFVGALVAVRIFGWLFESR